MMVRPQISYKSVFPVRQGIKAIHVCVSLNLSDGVSIERQITTSRDNTTLRFLHSPRIQESVHCKSSSYDLVIGDKWRQRQATHSFVLFVVVFLFSFLLVGLVTLEHLSAAGILMYIFCIILQKLMR